MKRFVAIACAVLGAVLLTQAGWIHAKALLAQVLVAHAWERTLGGAAHAPPWPWADTRPIARLTMPGRAPLLVLSGASGRNLAFGPVHDPASVLPGDAGNAVIAGHRDTHFQALRELAPGVRLRVERADRTAHEFIVTDRRVVDARTTRVLLDADAPRLTLVTCWPFDAVDPRGPLRLVITADLASTLAGNAVFTGRKPPAAGHRSAFTWHTAPDR